MRMNMKMSEIECATAETMVTINSHGSEESYIVGDCRPWL